MLKNVTVILLFGFLFGRSELIVTGTNRLYKGDWKILINVNLTQYKNELDMVRNNVALINSCCEEFKMVETEKGDSDTFFTTFISPELNKLNIAMTKYENNDNNMFNNINEDKRFKSNAIPELIFSDLSEILIEDEFKKMSLEEAQKSIKAINKTSFVSSTLNSITRAFNKDHFITNQLSFIQDTLSAVNKGSENVDQLFEIGSLIKFVITHQRYILSSFSMKQEKYGKIVSLVGKRSPKIGADILPKNILTDELIKLRNTLKQVGLDWPLKITFENLSPFFTSREVQMVNDQIYICLRFPLISKRSTQTNA